MIERLIDFSAGHRFIVLIVVAAAAAVGWRSMTQLPLDALPDVSDRQVVVYSRWDRSPDLINAQVTHPIVSALLGAPGVKSVRGFSDFGASFVHVLFDEGVNLYWARARTLEYLSGVLPGLPEGVKTELGPDATGLGWVFQYVLVDSTGTHDASALRSYQDWYLKSYLEAVPGVAEVATVGGLVRQYQVNLDPNRLRAYGISIQQVVDAVRAGNRDVVGQIIESAGSEYMVRGLGSVQTVQDLDDILVAGGNDHAPIRIKDIGRAAVGSEPRRGVTDLDGTGDVVSGLIVMRQGENALDVIDRVKARIRQLEPSLPAGMRIVAVYDRSDLIRRSIATLRVAIVEVTVTVALVIMLFLAHPPSLAVPLITLPAAVLISFIPLRLLRVDLNIMSLSGIALAIGALVDAAIVVVEQTHKRLEVLDGKSLGRDARGVVVAAIKQVARPGFFALTIIAVSFLPILTLQGEEGRLFAPLAYTKTLTIIVAAVLAITLDPALRVMFARRTRLHFRPDWLCSVSNALLVGTIRPEAEHPINRRIMRLYEPVVEWALRHQRLVAVAVLVLFSGTVPIWQRLGTEFMPPLDEGTLLFMPSTMPGISAAEAQRLLQNTDRVLKSQFPEVERVLGKAGRADTATDPAPLSMLETLIVLRPRIYWRRVDTWYSGWAPEILKPLLRHVTPDNISAEALVAQMNDALQLTGVANSWTMPVRGRIDMLATGVRTPLGLKITGRNVEEIERVGIAAATALRAVPGTRSVFFERSGEGRFLDVRWNRPALAQAGITVDEAQSAVQYAVGGENVAVSVQGSERYSINVRYAPDFRGDASALSRVLVAGVSADRQFAAGELAEIRTTSGPTMLRNDDGLLAAYLYIDLEGNDYAGYVAKADRTVRTAALLPPGAVVAWTGQYEAIERARRQLRTILPLTGLAIITLLYVSTRSAAKTLIVLLAVPFSAIGAVWLLFWLGYSTSVAVWVGLIALLGIDAETGVFMLLYLDDAFDRAKEEGTLSTPADLHRAVVAGAARRVRPKFMTVTTIFAGLLPIMWSTGTGSEIMKRIAAPMIGGIFTSFALELIVYPVVYYAWKSRAVAQTSADKFA